ncbi:MAG: DUF3168 domain-containing protein [Rhodobacteraceae bacterium]|nr:DUF3168 domain-containing protein [Paracoccaceae bacterium]
MADGYGLDLQVGIRAALVGNAAIAALVGARVYDTPPQPSVYPLIQLPAANVDPAHTDGTLAAYVTISIEAHSQSIAGSVECQKIIEAIRAVLDRGESSVTLANFALIELIEITSLVRRNTSGAGFTGVAVYRAYIDG